MNEVFTTQAKIRKARIEEIIGLRQRVLLPNMPTDTARLVGDDDAATWHIAIFPIDENKREVNGAISCASFMFSLIGEQPAWQLRGMATESAYQRRGLGRNLLVCAERVIPVQTGIHFFWCYAPLNIALFYEKKMGWDFISDEIFDIENAGLHRKMVREL